MGVGDHKGNADRCMMAPAPTGTCNDVLMNERADGLRESLAEVKEGYTTGKGKAMGRCEWLVRGTRIVNGAGGRA